MLIFMQERIAVHGRIHVSQNRQDAPSALLSSAITPYHRRHVVDHVAGTVHRTHSSSTTPEPKLGQQWPVLTPEETQVEGKTSGEVPPLVKTLTSLVPFILEHRRVYLG